MKKTKRFLSLLLVLCILASLPAAALQVSAADITSSLTISKLAAGSAKVLSSLESAFATGSKDSNGVYYAYSFPTKLGFAEGTIGTEEYTLMAANALMALKDGQAASTAIDYIDVTFNANEINCGKGNTLNKGQYLDLAERAQKYGNAIAALPSSFNRPSDGTNTYDGRISIYSMVHIFAEALAAYNSTGSLPESVTFVPAHASGVKNEEGTVVTTAAPTTTVPPTTTAPPTTKPPTTAKPSGATTVVSTTKITLSVIALEGYQIEAWIKENGALPNYSTLNTGDVFYPAQVLYMMAKATLDVNNGKLTTIYSAGTIDEAPGPNGDAGAGTIKKAEYIDMATRLINFMNNNGAAPNYCTHSTLGTVQYEECVYLFARIMSYYYKNGKLPDTIKSWPWGLSEDDAFGTGTGSSSGGDATFGVNYSAYAQYLKATSNCQSTNSTIISVAKTGMKYSGGKYSNPSTTYQAMYNLFEYLNDKTTYDWYYDTQKGALGCWKAKLGNCCDMAHLMNACARSLGVPGRYVHGYCRFTSGTTTGHVWSEVLCGTSWKTADLVSAYNYLGYKTNTNISIYGRYATLPF